MKEESDYIKKKNTWTLVLKSTGKKIIGTKWIFKKKLNEKETLLESRRRLVCKGHAQEEGLDYGEIFALVSRLEGVRLLLAYVFYKGFKVYQMDVKISNFDWCVRRSIH